MKLSDSEYSVYKDVMDMQENIISKAHQNGDDVSRITLTIITTIACILRANGVHDNKVIDTVKYGLRQGRMVRDNGSASGVVQTAKSVRKPS